MKDLNKKGIKKLVDDMANYPEKQKWKVMDIVEERLLKAHFNVEIGKNVNEKAKQNGCEINVKKRPLGDDEEKESLILDFVFKVKENVDLFELGELSGSVKNFMGLLQSVEEVKKILHFKTEFKKENNTYDIQLKIVDTDLVALTKRVLTEVVEIKNLDANVMFSHKFEDYELKNNNNNNNNKCLNMKVDVNAEFKRKLLNVILVVLQANKMNELQRGILSLFASLNDVEFELQFEDLSDFYTGLVGSDQKIAAELKTLNWEAAQFLLLQNLARLVNNSKVPPPVINLYNKTLQILCGIDHLKFVLPDDSALLVHLVNFEVPHILPSIEFLEKKEKETKDSRSTQYEYIS